MKKKCALILSVILCIAVLGGCRENKNKSNPTQQPTQPAQPSQGAKATQPLQPTHNPQEPTQIAHLNKINISINPEINLTTDDNGTVTDVEYVNEDAETAYGSLSLIGLNINEATELIVDAAASQNYLQDGMPITLTLLDTSMDGRETLDELTEVKEATQNELSNQNFDNSAIIASIELETEFEHDHTCDLCLGSGLLVCEECHGTTYLDGNAWTVCGMCGGEGRTLCTLCSGAGSLVCDSCGGTGTDASQSDGVCFQCHGTGTTPCNRCQDGAGYVVCYDCKGAGKLGGLPCNHCGGTLWGICNRCNGAGVTENN